ncbi:glycosyltransferase [Streptomyces sp. MA5143a]|uniref:glycosyltransferase n=1 Tax=Streptomyces sp. MA5143a TaxID=2083010 RepID=UPI000D297162|nr:glycosyltransferase [Streptomyces sp. MA5143a]SPE99693.1 Trehalose synthase [Streptomyces sp. MA5143a]
MPLSRLTPVVGAERVKEVGDMLRTARHHLDGRQVCHVSDTHTRGGVAELLHNSLPYLSGADISTQWFTLGASPEFRALSKEIYYLLCGVPRPARSTKTAKALELSRNLYERVSRTTAAHIARSVDRRGIVVLHDHHTAGLIPHLADAGCTVLWRAHIGPPLRSDLAEQGWAFLRRYLGAAHGYITSCDEVLPQGLDGPHHLVTPSINPLSPKNRPLDNTADPSRLLSGIVPALRQVPVITQVSRWDRAKDIPGVISAFVQHVDPLHGAHLLLVGPQIGQDREAAEVFEECRARTASLGSMRERVHLVRVPTELPDRHALLINAVQRRSTVVVQKSLAEGFGLTVSEAAWKGRPVVASPVGGLRQQVEDGKTGMLLAHAYDAQGFGTAINSLLADPSLAEGLGANGRRRVLRHFLTDSSLAQFSRVLVDASARTDR